MLGDLKMDVKFDSIVPEVVKGVFNEEANSNWLNLKPQIENDFGKYLSEIVGKILTALLAKVPIQDFFLS